MPTWSRPRPGGGCTSTCCGGTHETSPDASLPVALVPLLFDDSGVAGGADAVAELRVGMPGNIRLHGLPVILVVADALAVGADRQEPAQGFDLGERGLKL